MKNNIIIISILSATLLIPISIYIYKKRSKKLKLKRKVMADATSDYKGVATNIAMSISKSRELYKELIVKIHPDKFLDERKEIATEISARITKSKKNYDELKKIEIEINEFLNN